VHADPAEVPADAAVTVYADVTNTGRVPGDEVVQLYLTHEGIAGAPRRALQAFQRVHLAPGQKATVSFSLRDRALSVVDEAGARRIVPGHLDVWVGGGQPAGQSGRASAAGAHTPFSIVSAATLPD
jgi:beta-glucosidase